MQVSMILTLLVLFILRELRERFLKLDSLRLAIFHLDFAPGASRYLPDVWNANFKMLMTNFGESTG